MLPLATGPITFATAAVGGGTSTVNVQLLINQAGTLTITVPQSANSHQEFAVGTVTGCVTDGTTSVGATSLCMVPITFQPYYPGQRSEPLVVTLGGQVYSFPLTGYATGPQTRLDPAYVNTSSGAASTLSTTATPDNVAYTSGLMYLPEGLFADNQNNVYIAENGHPRVRLLYAAANPQIACLIVIENPTLFGLAVGGNTCAGATSQPTVGNIYTLAGPVGGSTANSTAGGFSGDNGLATSATLQITGVWVDPAGNIFIADSSNNRVRVVYAGGPLVSCLIVTENPAIFNPTSGCTGATSLPTPGFIYTIAGTGTNGTTGDGGLATAAKLYNPQALALDAAGDIFMTNLTAASSGTVGGSVRVIYEGGANAAALILLENPTATLTVGNIYKIAGNEAAAGFSGDGALAVNAAMYTSYGIKVDSYGNVYVPDKTYGTTYPLANVRVRAIYNGTVATPNPLANLIALENGGATAAPGAIYTIGGSTGTPQAVTATITKFSVASGVATITAANTFVAGQSIFISGLSTGTYLNVNPLTVLASGLSSTQFQVSTAHADVVSTNDSGTATGVPVDGILASAAQFSNVYDIALDAAGDVIVADRGNFTIRRISAATGIISRISGTPATASTISNGPALGSARFWGPWAITLDSIGGMYIADNGANRIRNLGATTTASLAAYTIPAIPTGTTSVTEPVIATNIGTPGSTLTITSATTNSPFAVVTPAGWPGVSDCAYPVTLNAGGSCSIGVNVTPLTAGLVNGTLTTKDNALGLTSTSHTAAINETATGTATTLTTNPTPPTGGNSTQLIATLVSGSTPVTSGSVAFSITGGASLGTATLDPVTGVATITTTQLAAPTTSITTVYAGATGVNPIFTPSTVTTVVTVSAKPATTTVVTATPNSISVGGTTVLSATVTSAIPGTITGNVIFTDGVTTLGTGTLDPVTGVATASVSTLAVGTRTVKGTYSGDPTYATSSGTTTVLVAALPTTTTVSAAPATANLNQTVVLTGTVSGQTVAGGPYSGSITFKDLQGNVSYGPVAVNTTTGVATFNVSSLSAATHNFIATYASDAVYGTSTSVTGASVVVTGPAFTISLTAVSPGQIVYPTAIPPALPAAPTQAGLSVVKGNNGLVTFTVQSVGGYAGTVTPSCALNGATIGSVTVPALPAGFTCIYTPTSYVFTGGNTTTTGTVAITTQILNSSNRTASSPLWAFVLPGAGLAFFGLRRRAALKTWQRMALFCMLLASGALGLSGCGSNLNLTQSQLGTYLVPITFSDGVTTSPVFQISVTVTGSTH